MPHYATTDELLFTEIPIDDILQAFLSEQRYEWDGDNWHVVSITLDAENAVADLKSGTHTYLFRTAVIELCTDKRDGMEYATIEGVVKNGKLALSEYCFSSDSDL